jgi:peptide chain release factor subunit 1
MISHADVEKLRGLHAAEPDVLSLYLPVPLDPASLRTLATRAQDLIVAARAPVGPDSMCAGMVGDADRDMVLDEVLAHGRDWLGHTVAIFACGHLDLFEALPLPCSMPERSVLATRPHVRPLLAALQRCPDYRVIVADRRHAWVLSVSGDQVRTVARPATEAALSSGFAGWHGLKAHHLEERVVQLARHHYRDIATILERADACDHEPLVIGGHQGVAGHLLPFLPLALRQDFAGSFTGDPLRLTPARVRELAAPVIEQWTAHRERALTDEVIAAASGQLAAPGRLAAVGLPACLAAVNAGAAALLLVPDEGMIPGFECGRCGALSVTGDDCPDWGTAARAVPDLLEEMAGRTLDDGGRVISVCDALAGAAVQLRFPVPRGADR